jgi:protein SCO1/2
LKAANKIIITLLFSALAVCFVNVSSLKADDVPPVEIGVDEKLGTTIPLDLTFMDEYGKPVTLRSLVTKPTIFTLVYYRCPGICSPLLTGVASMTDKMDMVPGKDYNIVTISFSPREDYIMASEKKKNYFAGLKKPMQQDGWRFLTGDSASIAKITDAIGFRYQKQGEDYMHSAVITVVSQKGQIARYLHGTDFLPLDVKLALTEASEGRTGPTINKLLKLCFSYDPGARSYVLNVTRIAGGGMILIIAGFVLMLTLKKKKNKNIPGINGQASPNGKGSI